MDLAVHGNMAEGLCLDGDGDVDESEMAAESAAMASTTWRTQSLLMASQSTTLDQRSVQLYPAKSVTSAWRKKSM